MSSLASAVQNLLWLGLPAAIYAAVVRLRFGLAPSDIARRLGLAPADGRFYVHALFTALPFSVLVIKIAPLTSGFQGSMIAPFVGATPTLYAAARVLVYGVVATGFSEELLFRGLIAGVLNRRLPFWKANLLQSVVFMLPHLLILLVAPQLWPLAIVAPLGIGLTAGWLRESSGSIVPAILLHAITNAVGALAVMNWGS
jgi:membrane protease YdiL (CAAX protease family)